MINERCKWSQCEDKLFLVIILSFLLSSVTMDCVLSICSHLCPGLHANAKIAIFAKNRKNRKWCKEEDKSPTRTRDFCDFSQKSLKSQKSPLFSGTCVLYHFSVVCMYVCKSLFKHGKPSVKLKLKTKTNFSCFTWLPCGNPIYQLPFWYFT